MQGSIMLVDDEPAMRSAVRRLLMQQGYRVHVAADGAEALEIWRELHAEIAVVITDVRMPNLSGFELAARLRAERPDLCVIVMTADAEDPAANDASAVLLKPFSVEQMLGAVERALAGP